MSWILMIAAGIAVAYSYSLWRRPYRDCWRCHGSKDNTDTSMWRGARGRCWACGGSGDRIRWGVALFRRKTYRAIKSGRKGRNF